MSEGGGQMQRITVTERVYRLALHPDVSTVLDDHAISAPDVVEHPRARVTVLRFYVTDRQAEAIRDAIESRALAICPDDWPAPVPEIDRADSSALWRAAAKIADRIAPEPIGRAWGSTR